MEAPTVLWAGAQIASKSNSSLNRCQEIISMSPWFTSPPMLNTSRIPIIIFLNGVTSWIH